MSAKQPESLTLLCRCGAVEFEAIGKPIVTAACYCASCQEAGAGIERLVEAPPVLEADGSTSFVLHRKDRIRCTRGGERLEDHRLSPAAPTRRVVATCCNSAMFLEFSKGHWLSLYRNRVSGNAPSLEMRVMTRDRREGVMLSDDLPSYETHSGKFMWRLLTAWAAMGFRVPPVGGLRA
jgi:hypothetical protein